MQDKSITITHEAFGDLDEKCLSVARRLHTTGHITRLTEIDLKWIDAFRILVGEGENPPVFYPPDIAVLLKYKQTIDFYAKPIQANIITNPTHAEIKEAQTYFDAILPELDPPGVHR